MDRRAPSVLFTAGLERAFVVPQRKRASDSTDSDLDVAKAHDRQCRPPPDSEKVTITTTTVVDNGEDDEGVRTVSIPKPLLPLLERIARERGAEDRVCPVVAGTPEKNRADIYREHLQTADVDHAPFYVETPTHLMINFRWLRDSGITWRFLAEHRESVVQHEAGHEHIRTTLGCAKEVQDRQGRYGDPFPALPDDLIGPSEPGPPNHFANHPRANTARQLSGRRDLNAHEISILPKDAIHPVNIHDLRAHQKTT